MIQLPFIPAPDWTHAACRGTKPKTWDGETLTKDLAIRCHTCPINADCLDYALRFKSHGIWAGTSTAQRKRIKRGELRKDCPICRANNPRPAVFGRWQICLSCGISWPARQPRVNTELAPRR